MNEIISHLLSEIDQYYNLTSRNVEGKEPGIKSNFYDNMGLV